MLGIRGVRRGIIYMTASARARTAILVTELVSQPEMSPLNEVSRRVLLRRKNKLLLKGGDFILCCMYGYVNENVVGLVYY